VTPCLVIVSESRNNALPASSWEERLREFVLRSFQRVTGARAQRRVDLSKTLLGIPLVRRAAFESPTGVGETSMGVVHDVIAGSKVDVILKLGSASVDRHIVSMTRHGVWGISRTREPSYAGGPPSFWEIVNGDPVMGGCLYRLTDTDCEGEVLRDGYVKTIAFMPGLSLNAISFECARWPLYAIAEIVNGAPELPTFGTWRSSARQIVPTWCDLARFFVAAAMSVARLRHRLSLVDEWHVGNRRALVAECPGRMVRRPYGAHFGRRGCRSR
jgi:hypothetical protein